MRSLGVSQIFKTCRLGCFIVGAMNDTNSTTSSVTAADPDIALLDSVLTKTGDLLAGVKPEQRSAPTPCAEYDVDALMDRIVGWAQMFAAGSNLK